MLRVVVLGGAGNFGARIVRALQGDTDIEVVSAGRRLLSVPGAGTVRRVVLDVVAADFPAQLAALSPGLVIHCVGPFQGQTFRVAEAALAVGAHYIDLADGREFVSQFARALDANARLAGKLAISGASTLPALSSAVVEALDSSLESILSVDIAIAPGQRAPRGAATLAAVFSYLGRPFPIWRKGRWQKAWGWMDLRRIQFAFDTRWGAACDVPDLVLLPQRYPELQTVRFHAALEIGVQHLILWSLAGLRRMGVSLPMERLMRVMTRTSKLFDSFGGQWGGMRISLIGVLGSGKRVRRTWQLTAPALSGPEIPTLAAILLAQRFARGTLTGAGAHACLGFLKLSEFEPEFVRWGITTTVAETAE